MTGRCGASCDSWVAPASRGRGAGDEAIRQVVAWAHDQHPGHALVVSVKPGNRPARALYERHGFVDAGPSPDDPQEWRMRRSAGGTGWHSRPSSGMLTGPTPKRSRL